MSIANPAGRLRGTAAGLLTAALAVAAHSVGSGAPPTGAVVAQLAVLAATVGALAATIARAADARVLLGLLAAGQLCGHVILSAVGHTHAAATAPPAAAMLVAHVVAVGAGALLIATSDRLCRAVSRAVRVAVSDRRHAGRRRTYCGDRRGRSAAAFCPSPCRFGVAPGSAGQPLPLTDIPKTQESHIECDSLPGRLCAP